MAAARGCIRWRCTAASGALIASAEQPDHLSAPQLSTDGTQLLYSLQKPQRSSFALMRASTHGDVAPERVLPEVIDARWAELTLAGHDAASALVAALVPADAPQKTDADDDNEPHVEVLDPSTGKLVAAEDDAPRPALVLIDPGDARDRRERNRARASHSRDRRRLRRYAAAQLGGHELRLRTLPPRRADRVGDDRGLPEAHRGRQDRRARARARRREPRRAPARTHRRRARALELLTKGTLDVQSPIPAAAAPGYAYERVLPRKYGELQHVAVCFDAR